MRKRIIRSRRARYGGMTVLLTVLLIVVVVMTNILFSTLAERYSWYANFNKSQDYALSEDCYTLLGSALAGKDADIEIIFCDTEENLLAEVTTRYLYQNAKALEKRFGGQIRVSNHNILLNPLSVKHFNKVPDFSQEESEETVEAKLTSTNVIISHGSYYRVYELMEFYAFAEGDASKLWAYKGERKLASGIMRALNPDGVVVGITNNHGELVSDYELLYLLDDAGYTIRHFDLYSESIPENCDLIVSFNPNSDLTVADGASDISEVDKLHEFLSEPGHSFFVFLGNATPRLPNFEDFLAQWGVETVCTEKDGYRYMVQDTKASLTSDGYTIYGQAAATGMGAEMFSGLSGGTVFKNATALGAAKGYIANGDGSYTKGDRTMYGLFTSGEGAVSWANGQPVDDSAAILFALTEQKTADAKSSYVGVFASTEMVSEEFLQSAVHGNTDAMMHIFEAIGKTNTPKGLKIKPIASSKISTVTTAQMWKWTLILAVTPAVLTVAAATVILVKRKRA